jgi:hypothetical protein
METLKENENFRVRLVNDESGDKPYDEGAVPILSREFGDYRGRFEAVNAQAEDLEGVITDAYNRLNRDSDVLARYLRIFYGAYSVMEDSSSNCAYLAFDTAAWRTEHELTDEYLDAHTEVLDRKTLAQGSLNEVMAWANGEVYGYVLERRYIRNRAESFKNPVSGEIVRVTVDESPVWESVDECYGYFGYDVAKEAGEEAFDAATTE